MTSNWIDKQFDDLKKLADDRFAPLSEAEIKMLRAAIAGETTWCGPSSRNDDPYNDPSSVEQWGPGREIRAEVLRWLCIEKGAELYVDPWGIRVHGAKILSELNLSSAALRFPLVLNRCRLTGDIRLFSAEMPFLDLSGSFVRAIRASYLRVKGSVFLNSGFIAEGYVQLMEAQLDGGLTCEGGSFRNPYKNDVQGSGSALSAENISVGGSIHLRHGFQAEGEVWLKGAQIGGSLECDGGIFKNPEKAGVSITGSALVAENISVKGSIFLRNNFVAEGEVHLLGARVGGDLECHDATFEKVIGARMAIDRTFFWLNIKNPENLFLALRDATVGVLVDDRESWPTLGKLDLGGFTYGRIAHDPIDSQSRLEWLGRNDGFTPQPYRQLAKILREDGDDAGARHVLYEMEKRKHQEARHGWAAKLWNVIFRGTIGYGIYPRRALWWLLVLIVMGWGVYWGGYFRGAITPTNKEAYEAFHSNGGPPPNYQHFSALVYSAEHCFPLVNLGQKEAWTPDPNRLGSARFLRVFRWLQILLGWTLATFFVAGVTGIARKD